MASIMEEDVKEETTAAVEDTAEAATTGTTPNYEIDYSDSRFADVEAAKKDALAEVDKTYDGMLEQSDSFYNAQIDAAKQWEKTQTDLQNQQTDFAIEQIEQQKEQEEKDYQKEQSGAYVDWQKQSNKYGADAEKEAASGMSGTGYSESVQASMYNAYQQRLTKARESFKTAIQNYNNSITQARLQNNSALAQIAYQSLQQQLELALQGFQYKNQLLLDKADKKLTVENQYYSRWQDVLNQMNTENALAEQIRQYNESLAEEQRQFNYYNKLGEFATTATTSGGGGDSGSSKTYSKPKVDDDDETETGSSGASKEELAEDQAHKDAVVAANKAGQLTANKQTSTASLQQRVEAARKLNAAKESLSAVGAIWKRNS